MNEEIFLINLVPPLYIEGVEKRGPVVVMHAPDKTLTFSIPDHGFSFRITRNQLDELSEWVNSDESRVKKE